MLTDSTKEKVAGGIDQSYRAEKNHASLVENFRTDDDLGWVNDRGWEPLLYDASPRFFPSSSYRDIFSPVRFLQIWSRHQGAEVYYFYERAGQLRYDFGNLGRATTQTVTLDTDRNLPKADDPGTQLVPYGRFAVFVNGHDKPLLHYGRKVTRQFSWTAAPPAPRILDVAPALGATGGANTTGNDGESCTIRIDPGSLHGVGDPTQDAYNQFSYRMTWVSDTGSESPLSTPGNVSWVIGGNGTTNNMQYKFGVYIQDLPIGPPGTVARRIYRTKNKKNGITGAGDTYYLVKQIDDNCSETYIDVTPDNQLVDQIDTSSFSQAISHGYKYGAAWNNQFWLAGGEAHPTRLIYSRPNLPEEFPRFNYFDVGVRQGGHITALYPFYNSLLVFREKALDVITVTGVASDGSPSYTIGTLDQNVGTTATNTIQLVPGVGVVFLTRDGFYAVTGGLQGGAVHRVQKISDKINREMKRLTVTALARATATYSDREKEYWCHYPVDGQTENSRGAVLHTRNVQWSLRNGTGMKFTQLASDPNGWIVMGLWNDPGLSLSAQTGDSTGLQVWSACRYWGKSLAFVADIVGILSYDITDRARGLSKWRSIWDDFGDSNLKKQVMHVELEIVTSGDNEVELLYATDWKEEALTSAGKVSPQAAEVYATATAQPVYGPYTATTKAVAIWGTSKWSDGRVTRMRWDVPAGLCSHFLFEVRSNAIFQVLSYKLEYRAAEQKTIHQRSKAPGDR